MTDLSPRETAARAAFEVIPPTHRHDGSDVTWYEATVSPWARHWVREVEIAHRRADAVLAAVADHDGLADVLAKHERVAGPINGMTTGPIGGGHRVYCRCTWTDWNYAPPSEIFAAHLADVVRAWLRGDDVSGFEALTVADAPAADDECCGWCSAKPTHAPEDCPRARDYQSQQIADAQTAADDEGGQE